MIFIFGYSKYIILILMGTYPFLWILIDSLRFLTILMGAYFHIWVLNDTYEYFLIIIIITFINETHDTENRY